VKIKSVQELEDNTVVFEGELNNQELAIALAFGLNTMLSMGVMEMIPNVQTTQMFTPDMGDDGLIQ
jgi:hypothetical protein